MDDLKNLTTEKVIPVTPEKQEEMSWEATTEPPVTPEKQEEEVFLWQPYQTPKYWAYHENYTSDWFDELQDETMVEYMFRGHVMKRAPKREYHVPGEVPPVYKWGQQKIHYPGGSDYTGLPMPDWMIMLKDKINMDFNANTNHAIIIKYSDGVQHHAPPHQDKIPYGTDFFVLSFGEPRKFEIINSENEVVWSKYLEEKSLLHVTSEGNKMFKHAVPPDPNWQGKPRYSLIFRTI